MYIKLHLYYLQNNGNIKFYEYLFFNMGYTDNLNILVYQNINLEHNTKVNFKFIYSNY